MPIIQMPVPMKAAAETEDPAPFWRETPAVDSNWGPSQVSSGRWVVLWDGEPASRTYTDRWQAELQYRWMLVHDLHEQDRIDQAFHHGADQ